MKITSGVVTLVSVYMSGSTVMVTHTMAMGAMNQLYHVVSACTQYNKSIINYIFPLQILFVYIISYEGNLFPHIG